MHARRMIMLNRYARTKSRIALAALLISSCLLWQSSLFAAQTRSTSSTQTQRPRRATPARTPTSSQSTQTAAPSQSPRRESAPVLMEPMPPPPPTPRPTPTPVAPPAAADDDDEVINVVSKLVVVPVSVTDARGEPVRGLSAADFRIEERGRQQEIAQLGDPEEVPLDIALLIDISGSVNERFAFEREAAGRFLRQVLRAPDRATVFTIGEEARRLGERAPVDAALRNLAQVEPTRSMTVFFDTVAAAADYLARTSPPRTRRVVVCISDGDDRFSERFMTSAATIPELQRAEVTFYGINPGGNSLRLNVLAVRGQTELVNLSSATGGTVFVPEVFEDLDKIFRQITAELRSQYLLQYYSNNDAAPGQFLPITVRTPKRPDLRVRARQGYFAGTTTTGTAPTSSK